VVTLLIVEKEERTPMNRKQKEEWTRFHSGKWTLAMPEAPGRYPTMGVLGDPGDVITVVGLPSGGLYTPSKWRGYFWSEPLPDNYGLPALSKENKSRKYWRADDGALHWIIAPSLEEATALMKKSWEDSGYVAEDLGLTSFYDVVIEELSFPEASNVKIRYDEGEEDYEIPLTSVSDAGYIACSEW
tara:strand:+ start:1386 stop:1943 length:558 start_codon:yes stop_codon:yes gene_type:complete